jgi:hypothetical protein
MSPQILRSGRMLPLWLGGLESELRARASGNAWDELWWEISLMSHWVRDSLLVRWAELTARLFATPITPWIGNLACHLDRSRHDVRRIVGGGAAGLPSVML